MTLRTRNSAAYKGVYALLMRGGGMDWMENQPLTMATFFDYKVDIHHVFPKAWCKATGTDELRRESIVNKTALSRSTNIRIGGRAPSSYLAKVQADAGVDAESLDAVVRTHAIEPATLRADDFDAFFAARAAALLEVIETAMGKPVVRTGEATGEQADAPEDFAIEDEEPEVDITDETGNAA